MLDFGWFVVLLILIIFGFIGIGIISIRSTWDNIQNREFGMIWLYVALGLSLLAGLLLSISMFEKPQVCKLPYSGKISKLS